MFSRYFIDRPILAAVPSIIITLAGLVAVTTLPMAQYPEVTPPTVRVSCTYPGASAAVVADTVAAPIEQSVNGVEDMLYMSSSSSNDGTYQLTVTFKVGTDLNMAQVLVQNRVAQALPTLPDVVKQIGVTTQKRSPDLMMIINLICTNGRYDQLYLGNYALMQVRDEIARLDGVGDVFIFGQRDYSMRIWLDPDRLIARDMTAGDVVEALREQNVQVAAGQLGEPPAEKNVDFQYTLTALGRLTEPDEFANIIVKTGADGQIVRLSDVARVEMGAKNEDVNNYLDGQPAAGMGVFQLPGSNALEAAAGVKSKMEELAKHFPQGVEYKIYYDTTPYISESINEVFKTLRDAVLLVALVVLLFLQNWRSSLIPLIAVPVAIIGTFAAMSLMGFSLNTLSLFGLVLAIGIVVDDAIVVVEATEHHIEQGMAPRAAAHQAMSEVSAPIIAIGLVLASVFVPCIFITGITGRFFRQFALTIAVSTVISAFNSLTLSPALCALLLETAARAPRSALLAAQLFARLVLQAVQQGLRPVGERIPVGGGQNAPPQPAGAGGLRRAAVSDRLELQADAHRLHSRPGPGLSVRGRPASRLGLAATDRRGHGQGRRHHPQDAGRRPYDPHFRHLLYPGGQRLAPGHDVHCPRSV